MSTDMTGWCALCRAGSHDTHNAALGGICVGCACPVTAADRPSVTPRVGDIITTADQLDALPVGSVVLHDSDVDPPGIAVMQRSVHTGAWYLPAAVQRVEPLLPVTVLFVPSRPVATCGHPNHGADDHDCAPFLPSVTDNARAEAWDEGYEAGRTDAEFPPATLKNPYRAAGRAETTTATDEDAARVIDALGRHWWSTQTGETETPWDDLTDDEKANVVENAYIDVLVTPVLDLLATARTRPTRTIYSVQAWEDADDIRASWVTGYGQYTHSRSDAEATLRHQERQHPDTTFRLAQAQVTPWTEAE